MNKSVKYCLQILGLIFWALTDIAAADAPKLDSLYLNLEIAETEVDSLEAMSNLCRYYRGATTANQDSVRHYGSIILERGIASNNRKYEVFGLNIIMITYYNSDKEKFKEYSTRLLKIFKEDGKKLAEAQGLYRLAGVEYGDGNLALAESIIDQSLHILDSAILVNNKENLKTLHLNVTRYKISLMVDQSKHIEVLPRAMKFLEDCKASGNLSMQSRAHGDISEIYQVMADRITDPKHEIKQEYDSLRFYHLMERYNLQTEADDLVEEHYANLNLGQYYSEKENYIKAYEFLQYTVTLGDKISAYPEFPYRPRIMLGELERKRGNYLKSIEALNDAEVYIPLINSKSHNWRIRYEYASTYFAMGSLVEAYEMGKEALIYSDSIDGVKDHLKSRKLMYEIAKTQQKFEEALMYHEASNTLKDSIENMSRIDEIDALRTNSEVAEKDKVIAELETEKAKQQLSQQRIITGLLFLSFGLAGLGLVFFQLNRNRILKFEKKSIEIEHKLLRSQMNPHFTFNTLGSIQNFLLDSGQASKGAFYLAKFAKLMRKILNQSKHTLITMEEEIDTLQTYMELQKLRYENKFDYKITISEELDPSELMVPPMLIQPSVENAIEHGKVHTLPDGLIEIKINSQNDLLNIEVTDNGIGKKENKLTTTEKAKHKSVATSIIKERFDFIRQIYGSEMNYTLSFPEKGGSKVIYNLPLLNK